MIRRVPWTALLAVTVAVALVGCGPSEEELAQEARTESWTQLQTMKDELDAARAELAMLQEQLAAGAEAMEVEGDQTAEEAYQELEQQAAQLEQEVTSKADAFIQQLVNFINEDPIVVGEEPTEVQRAALRMKSDEDIVLAMEYVNKGGDYRRALDILERAADADPDYARLEEVLAEVEEFRYVDKDRFDQVEEGMTQEQVRAILGQVYHGNVREYEDRDVLAWFYPKDPEQEGGRAAAAVYFREDGGELLVYQADWEAVSGEG